jgi:hypothetical protein
MLDSESNVKRRRLCITIGPAFMLNLCFMIITLHDTTCVLFSDPVDVCECEP